MGFDQHFGSDNEHHAADDAMAIFMAFNSPEIEVIGLTTIFGNVRVPDATRNALIILQQLEQSHVRVDDLQCGCCICLVSQHVKAHAIQVPVAEGVNTSLAGLAKVRVADFVHGTDGLGNTNQPTAKVEALPPRQTAVAHEALLFTWGQSAHLVVGTWPSAAGNKPVDFQR